MYPANYFKLPGSAGGGLPGGGGTGLNEAQTTLLGELQNFKTIHTTPELSLVGFLNQLVFLAQEGATAATSLDSFFSVVPSAYRDPATGASAWANLLQRNQVQSVALEASKTQNPDNELVSLGVYLNELRVFNDNRYVTLNANASNPLQTSGFLDWQQGVNTFRTSVNQTVVPYAPYLPRIPQYVYLSSVGLNSGLVVPPTESYRLQPNADYVAQPEALYSRNGTQLPYAFLYFSLPTKVDEAFRFTVLNLSTTVPLRLWCATDTLFVRGNRIGARFSLATIPPRKTTTYLFVPELTDGYRHPSTNQTTEAIVEFDWVSSDTNVPLPTYVGNPTP